MKIWKPKKEMNKENFCKINNSGLTKKEIEDIRSVFLNYPQIKEVLIYGSRAMGNYKPASDIDLCLIGKDIDLSLQTEIEFDLDDLMLHLKFDLSIYGKIITPEFKNHIDRVGKEIYKRKILKYNTV